MSPGISCTQVSKETYTCVKRDLHMCQKRPTHVSKETYACVKRDLHMCQKRHTHVSGNQLYSKHFFSDSKHFSSEMFFDILSTFQSLCRGVREKNIVGGIPQQR